MTNPYERRENPFALVWSWLSGGMQQVLEVFRPLSPDSSTQENGLRFRKILRRVDKKMEAKRLVENNVIKEHFLEERRYERDQLEQQLKWLSHELNETSDSSGQLKIQSELDAIKSDIDALLSQEKEVEIRYQSWKSAHFTCEKPAKAFRRFGKEFAASKAFYQKAVKDLVNVEKARLQKHQAQKDWEKAQHHWASASKRERRLEKEFEMAAGVSWPTWKSEAGSLTMQMMQAA